MTTLDVRRIAREPVVVMVFFAVIAVVALFGYGRTYEANVEVLQTAKSGIRFVGGPDAYGYSFQDSNQQGGPPFAWIDISTTGTNLQLADDSNTGLFPIGFDFEFYGMEYAEINVSSEGNVTFGTPAYVGHENVCIPGLHAYGSGDYPMIAVYWDDIEPTSLGNVFYDVQGIEPHRRGVIAWEGFAEHGGQEAVSFEVILEENDGSIFLQYLDVEPFGVPMSWGGEATIGIQDFGQSRDFGLQYSCNEPLPAGDLSVMFSLGLVFADGFESGGTDNWSSTNP